MAQQTFNTDASATGSISNLPPAPEYETPWDHDDPNREHYENSGKYGIMYAGDYEWTNERCTAEAYGDHSSNGSSDSDKNRSLVFCTGWMNIGGARDCLSHAGRLYGGYQGFSAEGVEEMLESLSVEFRVVVARECKPALYLWTNQPVTVMEAFTELPGKPGPGAFRAGNEQNPHPDAPDDAPSPPTALGAFPNADVYPTICLGEPKDEIENGVPTLVAASWQ